MALGDAIARLSGLERLRASLAAPSGRERVLPTYQNRENDSLIVSLLVAACIVYACVSGYFLGVFQQFILQQFLAPCLALAALGLWALPDRSAVSHKFLERGFFALAVANIIWPSYLAVAVPGLPWITLSKFVLIATLLSFGIVLATDRNARSTLGGAFREGRPALVLLVTFVIVQFVTSFFSDTIGETLGQVTNMQLLWTAPLLVAALVCAKPGQADLLARWMVAVAGVLMLLAVWEYRLERPPWVGHIPSFLKVNDPVIAAVLDGSRRSSDGLYRVQTTYTTSLSSAEFLAMVMPFIIHYFLTSRSAWLRLGLLIIYFGVIFAVYTSRARLGMIGIGIAHLSYPLLIALRRRATVRNDLVGPSLIALYPAALAGFMGLLLASRRLYVMFIGGGQHQASNDARTSMYQDGIPLILGNPWGFGANQGAAALNYRLPSGMLTIDSYYLSIGLDYGVLGFIAFYGMILYAIYVCVRIYLSVRDEEATIAAPLAMALGIYFIIKAVLSQPQNQPFLYILVGVAIALNYRFAAQRRTPVSKRSGRSQPAAQFG